MSLNPLSGRLAAEEYKKGILSGDRAILSKAITITESELASDQLIARELMTSVLPYTGKSIRIGITGVPGAGKSTFIESLGKSLTALGKKTAVLTIDPSSSISGGSILGDKTRMEELSLDPLAYIRPSPAAGSLGGVGRKTKENMLICEAAGYEVILVETVGIGQSETEVKGMVDIFLLIMLTGAGDELQMMKKGVMELADIIVINKADGDNVAKAEVYQHDLENILSIIPVRSYSWEVPVLLCSALEKKGMDSVWNTIQNFSDQMQHSGLWQENRRQQNLHWMYDIISDTLEEDFFNNAAIKTTLETLEKQVAEGEVPVYNAAIKLLDIFKHKK